MPPLSAKEALEATAIHSVAGLLDARRGVVEAPPFRAPHHSVSEAGLIGGGSYPRPGELSLSHHGVLFLDELPEFRRGALEALRQPLEERQVQIVRARHRTSFPAYPLLIAAMNPCPCGNWGSPQMVCRCTRALRLRYLSRISGPLLDRIDLHVVVPPVDLRAWTAPPTNQHPVGTKDAQEMVARARLLQRQRFERRQVIAPQNSLLSLGELERVADPDPAGKELIQKAIEKNLLSARGYVRVLRIARTLADLAMSEQPTAAQIGEALRYRISDLSEI